LNNALFAIVKTSWVWFYPACYTRWTAISPANGRLAHPILSNYTNFGGKRVVFCGKIGDVPCLEYNFTLVHTKSIKATENKENFEEPMLSSNPSVNAVAK
jgi:hypothetical protein